MFNVELPAARTLFCHLIFIGSVPIILHNSSTARFKMTLIISNSASTKLGEST